MSDSAAAAPRYHAVRHDVAAQHHALREFYWPRYRKWVLADTDRIRRLLQRNEPGAEVLAPAAWAERSIRRRRDDECTDRGGHAPRRPEPLPPLRWTEILLVEGYPWFRVHDLADDPPDPTALRAAAVVVVAAVTLTAEQEEELAALTAAELRACCCCAPATGWRAPSGWSGPRPGLAEMRRGLRDELAAFERRYGRRAVSIRGHSCIWVGWTEGAVPGRGGHPAGRELHADPVLRPRLPERQRPAGAVHGLRRAVHRPVRAGHHLHRGSTRCSPTPRTCPASPTSTGLPSTRRAGRCAWKRWTGTQRERRSPSRFAPARRSRRHAGVREMRRFLRFGGRRAAAGHSPGTGGAAAVRPGHGPAAEPSCDASWYPGFEYRKRPLAERGIVA